MPETADLRWIRARLVAREAGLLSEEEDDRFDELVRSDASCRLAWERFLLSSPAEAADPQHLSPYKIARWKSMQRTLRGLERRLVREHLEACSDCQNDLRALGHDPVLARVEELESQTPPVDETVSVSADTPPRSFLDRLRGTWSSLGPAWPTGWAVAATAGLLIALYRIGADGDGSIRPMAVPQLGLVSRSASEPTTVTVAPGQRTFVAALYRPDAFRGDDRVDVEIVGPAGPAASLVDVAVKDITLQQLLVIETTNPLVTGDYALVLRSLDGAITVSLEFRVEVLDE